jgi:ADP-heptose:LPS heptosyltransferase
MKSRRYLIDSPAGRFYVSSLDALLAVVTRPAPPQRRATQRLLLGIGGHIGDAVIATSTLPWIRRMIPGVRVGIALPSASRPVVERHPDVDWIHTVDHWKHHRGSGHRALAWLGWTRKRPAVLRDIRAVDYDVAVDLYPFYPNMSVLFWRAGILRRIGYDSGGGGPTFTDALAWTDSREHIAAYERQLLRRLVDRDDVPLSYDLPAVDPATESRARSLLLSHDLHPSNYVVLHPGSGDERKSWPVERWGDLATQLAADGMTSVITGAGAREHRLASAIQQRCPSVVDLCGMTDLSTLRVVLRAARFAVVIDSAAAHLAGAENVPSVVIMSPITDVDRWRPLSDRATVVMDDITTAEAAKLVRNGAGSKATVP